MVTLQNHGSIVLLAPDAADLTAFYDWVSDNVRGDALFFGDALAVEPRYASGVVSGLQADGFEVFIP